MYRDMLVILTLTGHSSSSSARSSDCRVQTGKGENKNEWYAPYVEGLYSNFALI